MTTPTNRPTDDTEAARFLAPETHQKAGDTAFRDARREREDAILARAARIMEARAKYGGTDVLDSPATARRLLQLRLAHLSHEEFHCLWLDSQHRLLVAETLFRGTLTQTSVYPREVVKAALIHNAAAAILAHNHPSGTCEPSRADELLTDSLSAALGMIDVRVLDHVVVTLNATYSFAEHGKL